MNNFLIRLLICLCSIVFTDVWVLAQQTPTVTAVDQDVKLAQQYFQSGEYEKALPLYKKLYEANNGNNFYYYNYFRCMIYVKQYDTAEKLIRKTLKNKDQDNLVGWIDLGYLYLQQQKNEEAEAAFKKALEGINKNNMPQAYSVANSFGSYELSDYMLATYLKARDLLKDPTAFSYELAQAYKKQGKFKEMTDALLEYASMSDNNMQLAKNEFQRIIPIEEHRDYLEAQIYRRVQNENGNDVPYTNLLIWFFLQQKDYESAFVQVKALDRRFQEDGKRVFELAQSAALEKDYVPAIEAYEYVIAKGKGTATYTMARTALANTQMQRLENTIDYTADDLKSMEQNYLAILDELGRLPSTALVMRNLARLYALYIHDLDAAIALLENLIVMPAVNGVLRGQAKLELGDYYIMQGDVWEAALYYMQVDKDFKEDILGEDARFRNARLAYLNGDFEWAASQLDVLKASTSELIANDALELSVFILDNSGMDSTMEAMGYFARADLLMFQNKMQESLRTLDSLENLYPGHALADDILFRRGKIAYRQRQYESAYQYWEQVANGFAEDILADDAIFENAELQEQYFKDKVKAMELYEKIIVDYAGSLYTVEARKRYRKLRGDELN